MCSEGVSVWFACKLCKSFFLNADDFAYHKKKSHVQEFRNTKFIVFEEQTSPTASPPENWVSFLSPKEETHIRKIISSAPSPPTTTNLDYKPHNESIQSNQKKEFVEVDFESNKVVIFNSHDNGSDAENNVTNNCLALNDDFNSYSDVSVLQNQLLQSRVEPSSTGNDLADEKRVRNCSALIKPTFKSKFYSLKNTKQNKKNHPVSSSSNVSQTVIQSPHNPYVYLKRLNLITIQNASLNSNSTAHSHENNRFLVDTSAEPANELEVTHGDQHKFCRSSSTVISPPLRTRATTFGNCKHCSQICKSASELYVHENICHLKRQCENTVCIPCHLTFDSSDNLNAHNGTQHSTFISTATPETTKVHRTELANDLEAASKKQIQPDFVSSICSNSSGTNLLPLSINHGNDVYKTDWNTDLELDPVSNIDEFNEIPDLTTEVNLNYGDLLEVVKTEFVADANEDIEFPDVNHDPLESESRDVAVAEEMLILADNLDDTQASQMGFYCASCKIHFIHVREIKEHNKTHHVTPEGKKRFPCPYPDCETISSRHRHIKSHLQHVHSHARPFKCPHLDCNMSFKTLDNKRSHLKLHTVGRKFECPYTDCGKKTATNFNLRNHIQRIHSNVRPYKCPHPNCTLSFKVVSGLNAHLKLHAK